jgi:hypothetical protein
MANERVRLRKKIEAATRNFVSELTALLGEEILARFEDKTAKKTRPRKTTRRAKAKPLL